MNSFLPATQASILNIFRHSLALLGGVLLCLAPVAASSQSVTFEGTQQAVLSFSGLNDPVAVAIDGAGDVFLADSGNNRIVELPNTSMGYGSQTILPFSGLDVPSSVALDSEGNVFVADHDNSRVVELPKTSTGYGPQTTLPANGLVHPRGVVLDSSGDVFIADTDNDRVVELAKTGTGYGPQATLTTGLTHPNAIALDSAGDVFISQGIYEYEAPPVACWNCRGRGLATERRPPCRSLVWVPPKESP